KQKSCKLASSQMTVFDLPCKSLVSMELGPNLAFKYAIPSPFGCHSTRAKTLSGSAIRSLCALSPSGPISQISLSRLKRLGRVSVVKSINEPSGATDQARLFSRNKRAVPRSMETIQCLKFPIEFH